MKRFGIITGGLMAVAMLILFGTQLPSCATPEQTARLLKLADIGLAIASHQGVINPGDRIVISDVFAVLTSDGTQDEKLIKLTDIGLDVAVEEGLLHEGDILIIREAEEVLVVPPLPVEAAGILEALASETAKPPAVPDLTGGK
jgi:hypothetical protein